MYRYLFAEVNAGNHFDGRMWDVALGNSVQRLCEHGSTTQNNDQSSVGYQADPI
jgi:hypothetical protein